METPVRRQYLDVKRRYPASILFFRLGDFYETFDDDALLVARELDITLTSREMGRGARVPLAGVPVHSIDGHLARLVKRGLSVAICDQLADPATVKGLVPRDVVRVVTPGTVTEPAMLASRENNYLAALFVEPSGFGLAYADISTGEFACMQVRDNWQSVLNGELGRIRPAEIVLPEPGEDEDQASDVVALLGEGSSARVVRVPHWMFSEVDGRQALLRQLSVPSLEGFGCDRLPLAIRAAAAVVEYLRQHQRQALAGLTSLHTIHPDGFMVVDDTAQRSLEIWRSGRQGSEARSLLEVLDVTASSMGARLLRQRLGQPLRDIDELNQRLSLVAALASDGARRAELRAVMGKFPDFERLSRRIVMRKAGPRELASLRNGLVALESLRTALSQATTQELTALGQRMPDFNAERDFLSRALVDDPPAALGEQPTIRPGFAADLDDIDASAAAARAWVAALEAGERARTGIKSLKVGFNRVFGFYLEISAANKQEVPSDYQRRQTLAGTERYTTPDLKERESIILDATDRFQKAEREQYDGVVDALGKSVNRLLELSSVIAETDVAAALAESATRYRWVRPTLSQGGRLHIVAGRHPVVEASLPAGAFVPNDVELDATTSQLLLVTGPNMAGKSTYLRQAALIVLLAQIGSFVPAAQADIGVTDRIFTRIGAQDDLAAGQSTFMVEMLEVANILNHATPHSLVILDEVGRGTGTFDGLAIARAVIEYLHNSPGLRCRTLFATHYLELTELAESLPRVRCCTVAVSEEGERVIFHHHIVPGRADRSYGVHVARLAGVPRAVVRRAEEVLAELESERPASPTLGRRRRTGRVEPSQQMSLFDPGTALREEIRQLDVLSMTPMEALNVLHALKQQAEQP